MATCRPCYWREKDYGRGAWGLDGYSLGAQVSLKTKRNCSLDLERSDVGGDGRYGGSIQGVSWGVLSWEPAPQPFTCPPADVCPMPAAQCQPRRWLLAVAAGGLLEAGAQRTLHPSHACRPERPSKRR